MINKVQLTKSPLDAWVAAKIGTPGHALDRATIEKHQIEKLRETVRFACQYSPFYRRHIRLDQIGALRSLDDVRRLPLTELADAGEQSLQYLAVSQSQIRRVVSLNSSGTTGVAKRVFFTELDQELTVDFFQVGMSTLVSSSDRVLLLLPGDAPGSVGDLLASALKRLGAKPYVHGLVRNVPNTLDLMEREYITSVVGIPVQVLALVRHPRARSKNILLKSVLLSTDYVPDAISRQIHAAWGCEVFVHYGMTEMGLGGGVDCLAHAGYHLREADLFVEIINSVTGEPVAEGDEGEVVFTTLTRQGMPLIRYRTGDISRFLPGPCLCGSVLKRLDCIKSRKGGEIWINGCSLTLSELDEVLFSIEGVIDYSVLVDDREKVSKLSLSFSLVDPQYDYSDVVTEALDKVTAIREGRTNGSLAISVSICWTGDLLSLRTAKRTIKETKGLADE